MTPFGRPHNPFSTCHTGPEGVEYLFPPGQSLAGLSDEIASVGWRAELVGPHGVGKSTLLVTLEGEARRRGLPTARFFLNREDPRLPWGWRSRIPRGGVCFLDGSEVLSRRILGAVDRVSRRRGAGLVLTAHQPLGIAPAHEIKTRPEDFARLVHQLHPIARMNQTDAAELLAAHHGNAREALWALYDEFEVGG